MKRITFDKLTKYGLRANYPGYLFTHSAHPGREFAIARASRSKEGSGEGFRMIDEGHLYDRAAGVSLLRLVPAEPTMKEMEEQAMAKLFAVSAAQIDERVAAMQVYVATYTLQGEE